MNPTMVMARKVYQPTSETRYIGRMGAGLMGDGEVGRGVAGAVDRLFKDSQFRRGALGFAERNRDLPFDGQMERTLAAIEAILPL